MKTTTLKELKSEFEKVQKQALGYLSSNYKTHRDSEGNLMIDFFDGEEIKLPIIPLRNYQINDQCALVLNGIKRLMLQRPRRSGKEVGTWNILISCAIERSGLWIMNYPTNVRARAVLWDGQISLPDGSSFKFLDMIPERLIESVNKQEMKIHLVNGSIIWVMGSDVSPDKLRGTNPLGMVSAEFAFSDPLVFYTMLPVFRQNKGWWIGQSTYNGLNHFHELMSRNKGNPLWYCCDDSVENLKDNSGNRYITDEMIQEDRDGGMPEWMIQQEYYGKVQINEEKMYFAIQLKEIMESGRLVSGLFLPKKRVYSAWDIGVNDSTAIVLFQLDDNGFPVIIGYLENNNRSFEYYIDLVKTFVSKMGLVLECHYLPHDGKKREYTNSNKDTPPKSISDCGRELGETIYEVKRPASKIAAIQQMRQVLPITRFHQENTTRLIECLMNYQKEYDDLRKIFLNKPIHDWSSHGVAAYQTMTLAIESGMVNETPREIIYYNNNH